MKTHVTFIEPQQMNDKQHSKTTKLPISVLQTDSDQEDTEKESNGDSEIEDEDTDEPEEEQMLQSIQQEDLMNLDEPLANSTFKEDKEEIQQSDDNQTVIEQIFDYRIHKDQVVIPENVKQVLDSKYKEFWLQAMDDEHMCWLTHNAFELVAPTGREKVLNGRFIYSIKTDEQNYVTRFKARYVINGSKIEEKPDQSPVVSIENLRLVLAYAVKNKWYIQSLDFTTAFLNSEMKEECYVQQMALYEILDQSAHIMKMKKWSYGLPGSSYHWYQTLSEYLQLIGLTQSKLETCVFYSKCFQLMVYIYVDDLGIVSPDKEAINEFKRKLKTKFELKESEIIKRMIGIDFDYHKEEQVLYMSLKSKIIELYNRNIDQLPKPTKVPLDAKTNFDEKSASTVKVFEYRSNVGSLNYIANKVRSEITFPVQQLSRYLRNPTEHHEKLVYKLISYLYNTVNYVLKYDGKRDGQLLTYSDSNFSNPRSITGTVILYNGMLIN